MIHPHAHTHVRAHRHAYESEGRTFANWIYEKGVTHNKELEPRKHANGEVGAILFYADNFKLS